MKKVSSHLNDDGLFSLWSNNPPDIYFVDLLKNVFEMARAEKVIFYNPILEEDCTQTIYIAKK
ncbi:MAG: hypothetical protein O3A39_06625 [Proteobacteria bacterium]|nr:hypothetical protein [Pseudomonadota bacterium]MDA1135565.1 hypothetical protein [Pseudomonadota bacterium]